LGWYPGASVTVNPFKPRTKAFDIYVIDDSRKSEFLDEKAKLGMWGKNVWSGIKMTPRATKMPEDDVLKAAIEEVLK